MTDIQLSLVVSECEAAIKDCSDNLEARLRAAMKAAANHWMVFDKNLQFLGAVGAVMEHYGKDSPEYERLAAELDGLKKFNAIVQAAQAGLSVDLSNVSMPTHEPIGLMKLWHETTAQMAEIKRLIKEKP